MRVAENLAGLTTSAVIADVAIPGEQLEELLIVVVGLLVREALAWIRRKWFPAVNRSLR